ncbi:uncharacterized protein N7529_003671 [Penicillium soppii]|uniref:uncharacterized protein n=1 Tax=Penicillium soppii TaxID=69789 RepID=UPI0025493DE0|nr:uncharacterized protein N7529_003671 [Penicillium soppii]KAJ5871318.1 hypothetical protein N7529_003671 [Penicillium soppii]
MQTASPRNSRNLNSKHLKLATTGGPITTQSFRVFYSFRPSNPSNSIQSHKETNLSKMAPSHLLRATMSLRASLTTPLSLARPSILQSTTYLTTLRTASTSSTPKTTGTDTQAPSRLRAYASTLKTGTVVSVGRMDRTVRVLHKHITWDRHIRKYYGKQTHFLVSDPQNSLREGDVIEFSSGAPKSKHVRHVVERIVTPFGVEIADRPSVPSKEQREAKREQSWAEKYVRRESRRLGREVDLVEEAEKAGIPVEGEIPAALLIHRIHANNERVGKLKSLVLERVEKEKSLE